MANLHEESRELACPRWNYDEVLMQSATRTLESMLRAAAKGNLPRAARRSLPALKRFVTDLPMTRRALLADTQFSSGLIHGDVHPGNVLLSFAGVCPRVWFIDWERARAGSVLEDVSSWLRSLGLWEPEACRRHDSLLKQYLLERGCSSFLSSQLRAAHWAAGACNALSGALAYRLWQLSSASDGEDRRTAARCVIDYMRIIKRADAMIH